MAVTCLFPIDKDYLREDTPLANLLGFLSNIEKILREGNWISYNYHEMEAFTVMKCWTAAIVEEIVKTCPSLGSSSQQTSVCRLRLVI